MPQANAHAHTQRCLPPRQHGYTASFLCRLNLPQLALPPLLRAPQSTTKNSVTKSSALTLRIVQNEKYGLKALYYCPEIWLRLFAYVDYQTFKQNNVNPPLIHCHECPDAPTEKPSNYYNAYETIPKLESAMHATFENALRSNESIKFAVDDYIVRTVNQALMLRYQNQAANIQINDVYHPDDRSRFHTSTGAGEVIDLDDVRHYKVFFPQWAPTNLLNHILPKINSSGYADRVLLRAPRELEPNSPTATQVALLESRPFWSYPTDSFMDVLDGLLKKVLLANDDFNTGAHISHPGNLMIRQMFTGMVSQGIDVHVFSNGDKVIVAVHHGPRPTPKELTDMQQGDPGQSGKKMEDDDEESDQDDGNGDTSSTNEDTIEDPLPVVGINPNIRWEDMARGAKLPGHSGLRAQGGENPAVSRSPAGTLQTVEKDEKPVDPPGLILSPPMDWTDERLVRCIIALSYLALDEEQWWKKESKTLRDILCPAATCERIRAFDPKLQQE